MSERPWIEHDGSGCPFPPGTALDVEYRNGELWIAYPISANMYVWAWTHPDPGKNVVRYRLARDPEAEARRERYAALFDGLIKTAPLDLPAREGVDA